jgi:hypothetical protein
MSQKLCDSRAGLSQRTFEFSRVSKQIRSRTAGPRCLPAYLVNVAEPFGVHALVAGCVPRATPPLRVYCAIVSQRHLTPPRHHLARNRNPNYQAAESGDGDPARSVRIAAANSFANAAPHEDVRRIAQSRLASFHLMAASSRYFGIANGTPDFCVMAELG